MMYCRLLSRVLAAVVNAMGRSSGKMLEDGLNAIRIFSMIDDMDTRTQLAVEGACEGAVSILCITIS